ncbi:hypothetical protein V1287_003102 [Bradyrhizobium sp. AZCC 1699]
MPARRVLITETNGPSAGFVQRLFYNALASGLGRGRITVRINGTIPTLGEAEILVRKARQNGWRTTRPMRPEKTRSDSIGGEDGPE